MKTEKRILFLFSLMICIWIAAGCGPKPSKASVRQEGIRTCGSLLQDCDYRLQRHGVRVLLLGRRQPLIVPGNMRGKPVAVSRLVAETAAARNLKTSWNSNGTCAVLYPGASDDAVTRVAEGIRSAKQSERLAAAWQAGFTEDIRVCRLLAQAAADSDAGVRRVAARSMARLGWSVPLVLDKSGAVWKSLEPFLKHRFREVRRPAILAIGEAGGKKALDICRELLNGDRRNARIDAAEALGMIGGNTAVRLLASTCLKDKDLGVRLAAMKSLGKIGGPQALAALKKRPAGLTGVLEGTEIYHTEGVIAALGFHGSSEAVTVLEGHVNGQDRNLRLKAITALGFAGGPKAAEFLEKQVSSEDTAARIQAAGSLGRIGGERSAALLGKLLEDRDLSVRLAAASAFGETGGDRCAELLMSAAHDPAGGLRARAMLAMGNAGSGKSLQFLSAALKDADRAVRLEAISALARIGTKAALLKLAEAFTGGDSVVRFRIVSQLENAADRKKAMLILKRAFSDKEWLVRTRALNTAALINGAEALGMIEKSLTDEVEAIRVDARRLLADIGGPRAVAQLKKDLVSEDPVLRKAGMSGMVGMGGMDALKVLEKCLSDRDEGVRTGALNTLSRTGTEKAVDLIREKALNDQSAGVRNRAAKLLGGHKGEKTCSALLGRLKVEKDKGVRDRILRVLRWAYKDHPEVKKLDEDTTKDK